MTPYAQLALLLGEQDIETDTTFGELFEICSTIRVNSFLQHAHTSA
jgi:hypothetical protein